MSGFTILAVCTGNICRSPIAEQLLRTWLDDKSIVVSSAGVWAEAGLEMPDEAVEVSRRYGGHPGRHRPTQLTPRLAESADLVLTAELGHRAEVVRAFPRASKYSFTLKQFARLASLVEDDELAAVDGPSAALEFIASKRGFGAPVSAADDEILDPYLQGMAAYERAGREIAEAVGSIVRVFNASQVR